MRRQELKPLIYWVSAAIAAAGLIYNVETYNRDVLTAPHSPNLTTGNVVPYNNHGTTVYLTKRQALVQQWGPLAWIVEWVQTPSHKRP
jgi:hypothetical protein